MSDIIKTAGRKERRDFNKVFNNDLRKYIAEIVTNSDDSYNRMVQKGLIPDGTVRPIYINIIRKGSSREVVIIDNAEGMNLEDLEENFMKYGSDTSGGSEGLKARGLFGQGASDVLLNATLCGKRAEIHSIKDDCLYEAKFKWPKGGKKELKRNQLKIQKKDLRKFRDKFNIPANGTIIHFGLPDKVAIPRKLFNVVKTFYMLRFILNKPNRNVILSFQNGKRIKEKILKYEFPPESILLKKQISFNFEDSIITGELIVEKSPDSDEYGDLKILSYDSEQNVYDNDLFKYDNFPNAESIHGYLQLNGASEIIRQKLNQEIPEEILTDTRNGFNKHHAFYKLLEKTIQPHIISVLNEIGDEKKEEGVSLSKQKDWNKALKEINKYFKSELEENLGGTGRGIEPPINGLQFRYSNIKVTAGKKYTLKLLINIGLIPIGSKIAMEIKNDNLEVTPLEFVVSENDVVEGNLAAKSISITGLKTTSEEQVITAGSLNHYQARLFILVIDQEIHYPKKGLEFWPTSMVTKLNTTSKGSLYFDTTKHTVGSMVRFSSNHPNIELEAKSVVLKNEHLISDLIGVVKCKFTGKEIGSKYSILAEANNSSTKLSIEVSEKNQRPLGTGDFLTGVDIKDSDQFWQTFFNPNDGKININSGNNINKCHLGKIDRKNPKFSKNQNKYLVDVCSMELAKQMVSHKIKEGKIRETDYEAILDSIQKEKNELFSILIKAIKKLI